MAFLVNAKALSWETFAAEKDARIIASGGSETDLAIRVGICFRNAMKVLGYFIPVVGLIRIVCVLVSKDCEKESWKVDRKNQIFRGIWEVIGLGIVCLILDSIKCYREYKERNKVWVF